jgi:hypothetical protein
MISVDGLRRFESGEILPERSQTQVIPAKPQAAASPHRLGELRERAP